MQNSKFKISTKILILFFFVLFLFANLQSPITIHAVETSLLSLSPTIFNISLSPGKKYDYEIQIKNNTNVPLPIRCELESIFTPDDETPIPSTAQSIVSWVSLKDPNMLIPAKSERTLQFAIQVPNKIMLGGYYGMIYIQPLITTKQKSTDIQTRFGILLLGNIGVQDQNNRSLSLNNFAFDKMVYENDPVALSFKAKNNSLHHLSAKPHLVLQPLFGKAVHFDIEEKFIFPGKSRVWKETIPLHGLRSIIYRATLSVSIGNGVQQKSSTYLFVFPLTAFLCVVFLIITSIIVYNRRRQIKEAMKIMRDGS